MLTSFVSQVSFLMMVAVCGAAVVLGDRHVRWTGWIYAATWIATLVVQLFRRTHFYEVRYGIIAIDTLLLSMFLNMVVATRSWWSVLGAASALLLLLSQISYLFDVRLGDWAFYTVYFVWTYGTLLAVAWAAWDAWLRRRRAAPS